MAQIYKGRSTALPTGILLAVLLTVFSNFFFTASHGIIRHIGPSLHPFEVAFFSNLFSVLFYVPWFLKVGFSPLKTEKFRLHFTRSFFNAGALVCWYTALSIAPLGDAVALALTGPLFVTIGAFLFLSEVVRIRRWAALAVGVCGALIIIRPGLETVSVGFMFVLASALFGAGTKLFAKYLSRTDSAITCSAYVAILQTPITFVAAMFVWQTPNLEQLGWLAAVGVFVAIAHIMMVKAFSYTEVSALEPIVFLRLVFAATIGFLAFSEFPALWTWIGAAIIVASSSYIAHRESVAARNTATEDKVVL